MSQDVAAALARAPTCFTGCLNGNGQETQPRVDAGTLTAVCNTQAALIGAVPSNVNAVSAFSNCVANACTPSALDSIPAWQAANRPLLVTYCLASASPLSSSRASGTGTVSAAGTATTTRAFVSTLATLAPAIPDTSTSSQSSTGDGGNDAPRGVATDGSKNENGWLNGSNTRVVADTFATVVDDQAKYGVVPGAASGSSSKSTQRAGMKGRATIEYAKEKDNMHSSHTYVEVQGSFANLPPSGISRDHGPTTSSSSDTSISVAEVAQDLPPPPYTMF